MSHDVVRWDHKMIVRVRDYCLLFDDSCDVVYEIFTMSNFASS